MMEGLLLFFALALIAAVILPWVNMVNLMRRGRELEDLRSALNLQRSDLERLRQQVETAGCRVDKEDKTDAGASASVAPTAQTAATGFDHSGEEPADRALVPVDPNKDRAGPAKAAPAGQSAAFVGSVGPPPMPHPVQQASSAFSQETVPCRIEATAPDEVDGGESPRRSDWFSKVAIWVGGVALLMAGFYMVKYSIESGWLTPAVRLWLTAGFGTLLCGAGFMVSLKSKLPSNLPIGQALSGAGLACLYFAAYAAVHLYAFVGPSAGFGFMVGITVLAVALSLRNGAPIALMGLVGGFLTPWLMASGSTDTVTLFGYLFLLFLGAQFLCWYRGWWGLLLGSLAGAYFWSAWVITANLQARIETIEGALLFVVGICGLNGLWALRANDQSGSGTERSPLTLAWVRYLAWGGGLSQALLLLWMSGFGAVDMLLFGVLGVAALFLSAVREEEFCWAACLALPAMVSGVVLNGEAGLVAWLIAPVGILGLYFGVGHWRSLRSNRALLWRGLSLSAVLALVPALYFSREVLVSTGEPLEGFWLGLSMLSALLIGLAGEHLLRCTADGRKVAGDYQTFAVFLLAFGWWTFVPTDFLAHSLAILLAGVAGYWKWRAFARAEWVAGGLAAAWTLLMLPSVGAASAYFFGDALFRAAEPDGRTVAAWALGVVAGVSVLRCFGREWRGGAHQVLSWTVGLVSLFGLVACYQWLDQTRMPGTWPGASVAGGLTALLGGLAVLARWLASRRPGMKPVAPLLAGLAGLRLFFLHLTDATDPGSPFFFNALWWQFGIPFFAAFALAWMSKGDRDQIRRQVYQIGAMAVGFLWMTFLVQDFFGNSGLFKWSRTSTELYAYSVIWLLLAVAYQAVGLWRDQRAIHLGSLVLLLLTVGKVFFIDAAALEGLYRVLSFLGLGCALIGIGFFYNKVVFARGRVRGSVGSGRGQESTE